MTIRWTAVFTLLALVAIAAPVSAHHSISAEFDLSRHETVTGVITKLDWSNPHIWIYLDKRAPGENGAGWAIEGASPARLYGEGITSSAFSIGTRITVEGFSAKEPNSRKISGITVTLPDGKQLDIRDLLFTPHSAR